eukprot:s395_g34.t1
MRRSIKVNLERKSENGGLYEDRNSFLAQSIPVHLRGIGIDRADIKDFFWKLCDWEEVVAEKNPIAPSYKDHILKHTAMLKNPLFQLGKAADYLEQWVNGLLPPANLLDVSALERRKGTAKKVAVYKSKAESRLMLQMAAKSWANGVPWDEALRIAKQVSSRVDKIKKKRLGKGS